MRLLNSTMNCDRNLSTCKEREIDFKNSPLFSMDPKHLRLNSLRDKTDIGVFDRGAFKSSQRKRSPFETSILNAICSQSSNDSEKKCRRIQFIPAENINLNKRKQSCSPDLETENQLYCKKTVTPHSSNYKLENRRISFLKLNTEEDLKALERTPQRNKFYSHQSSEHTKPRLKTHSEIENGTGLIFSSDLANSLNNRKRNSLKTDHILVSTGITLQRRIDIDFPLKIKEMSLPKTSEPKQQPIIKRSNIQKYLNKPKLMQPKEPISPKKNKDIFFLL